MGIQIEHLQVRYKEKVVINDLSLTTVDGECFGLLGPNGAGKTTTIECIEGLRQYHKGTINVLGLDPKTQRKALSERIGIQLQESCYQDKIKVKELCKLIAAFFPHPQDYNQLLEEFVLAEHKNKYVSHLSGGLKQRLSIVLALIPNPEIVFLDELTTGLDPEARIMMWEHIKKLKKKGISIFITTHYLEEAEKLCDRIGIMNHGELIKVGTPEQIIQDSNVKRRISIKNERITPEIREYLEQFQGIQEDDCTLIEAQEYINEIAAYLLQQNVVFTLVEPTLEDAYLSMVGQEERQ